MSDVPAWRRQLARATNEQTAMLRAVARQKQEEGPAAMTAPNDWPPEAREAAKKAIHAKRYTRLGRDVLPMDNDDVRYCGALATAALAALAPFVAEIKAAAFKRGAEAMREKVVDCYQNQALDADVDMHRADNDELDFELAHSRREQAREVAAHIRALPIPEDKQL